MQRRNVFVCSSLCSIVYSISICYPGTEFLPGISRTQNLTLTVKSLKLHLVCFQFSFYLDSSTFFEKNLCWIQCIVLPMALFLHPWLKTLAKDNQIITHTIVCRYVSFNICASTLNNQCHSDVPYGIFMVWYIYVTGHGRE